MRFKRLGACKYISMRLLYSNAKYRAYASVNNKIYASRRSEKRD